MISICFLNYENKYEISKDKLKSRFGRDHAFSLSEIKVFEFSNSGEPTEFEKISTAYYISKHKNLGNKKSYRTFYFNRANGEKGFEWKWRIDTSMVYTDTLPLKLKNNIWYFMNLTNDCRTDNLLFKFLDNGKVIKFHNFVKCDLI